MTERTESSSASASTLTRQTRSAASAYVGEITASTAQTSTARLISNSTFVALLHLTTPHEECPRRVKSAVLRVGQSFPVCPQLRTFSAPLGMSQRCHEQSLRRSQPMV